MGYDNNVYVQIGLIMLIGLAAKNAILIVEFAKAKHDEGKSVEEAALESARLRFRPILMTAFAFILGVVPLMRASGAGAGAQNVMGTAVFWGMLVATALGRLHHPGQLRLRRAPALLAARARAAPGRDRRRRWPTASIREPGLARREAPRAPGPDAIGSWDLTRILLAVAGIGGLIAASFWVLRPFLPAMVWATMIVVATWPMLRGLEARLGGKRGVAVAVMTVAMLAILAAPLTLATIAIVERAEDVVTWSRSLVAHPLPGLPEWVARVPLVGTKIATEWETLARAPSEELAARVIPHVRGIAVWLLARAGGIGTLLLQLLLTVAIAAILYARGEAAGRRRARVRAAARRRARACAPPCSPRARSARSPSASWSPPWSRASSAASVSP